MTPERPVISVAMLSFVGLVSGGMRWDYFRPSAILILQMERFNREMSGKLEAEAGLMTGGCFTDRSTSK
jgi:hypothetical protein